MKINWLRKILNSRKKQTSTDVAKINTSLTYIPKIEELDNESKDIVLNYYKKINVYNYESLVKFSYDLVKKVDVERDVLINTMTRYREITKFFRERKFRRDEPFYSKACDYHYTMLSKEEYKVIVDEIVNTRKEVTLRYKALEMFIEKEKKDAKNPFNRQKRVMAKLELNGLINEQERLLTFITCIDQVCTAVFNTINTNIILNEKQEDLFEAESINARNGGRVYTDIGTAYSRSMQELRFYFPSEIKEWYLNELYSLLTQELTGKVLSSKFEFYDGFSFDNETIEQNILGAFFKGTDRWDWLIYTAPNNLLDKVYALLAKAFHKREVYLHEHYHDYDKLMKEMDELINMYEAMSIDDWDKDYLAEKLDYFGLNIREYITMFKECKYEHENEVSDEIIEELKKKLCKVGFLNEAVNGRESSIDKILSPKKIHKWHGHDFYYPTQIFYHGNEYFNELLKKVEHKYCVKFLIKQSYEHNTLTEDPYDIIRKEKFYQNEESDKINLINCLYHLLEGKTDFINIVYKSSEDEDLYKYICDKDYQKSQCLTPNYSYLRYRAPFLGNKISRFSFNIDEIKDFTTLEEIFYLTKYIDQGAFNLYYPLPETKNFYQVNPDDEVVANTKFVNFLARVKIRDLKNKFDHRITVVPRSIIFDEMNTSNIKRIEDLEHPNQIALYVSTYNQFEFLYKLCKQRTKAEYEDFTKSNDIEISSITGKTVISSSLERALYGPFYEYIFVDEDVYKQLNGVDYSTDTFKVIPVPKLDHYYEISKYLDMELAKKETDSKSK